MTEMQFRLGASPALAVLLLCVHAAAAGSAWISVPGVPGAALAIALLALGLAAAHSRVLHLAGSSVRALRVEGERVFLEPVRGAEMPVEIAERRYVGALLVVLFVTHPARRTVLVTRDMLDARSFRALRLWALWGRLPAAGQSLAVAPGQLSA